jgi:predicted metal-dependent enzyme (double-stranded beta helix superfamily)
MAYTLAEFCTQTRALLKSEQLSTALPAIAGKLSKLLQDRNFVTSTFQEDMGPGKRTLFHDPETDFYIFAHVQEGGKASKPHSHGDSWAIYGNARGVTEMTEWRRANPETEDHAELVQTSKYGLGPDQTHAYGPRVIHSTAHPEMAWVIRVTGTDLEKLPRYRFRKQDRLLEKA